MPHWIGSCSLKLSWLLQGWHRTQQVDEEKPRSAVFLMVTAAMISCSQQSRWNNKGDSLLHTQLSLGHVNGYGNLFFDMKCMEVFHTYSKCHNRCFEMVREVCLSYVAVKWNDRWLILLEGSGMPGALSCQSRTLIEHLVIYSRLGIGICIALRTGALWCIKPPYIADLKVWTNSLWFLKCSFFTVEMVN